MRSKNTDYSEKIAYWIDLWEDLIRNYRVNSFGFKLMNFHLLLRDLIDEIDSNSFRNEDVKKYFQRKVDELINQDVIFEHFKQDIGLIRREFGKTRYRYLRELCSTVLKELSDGKYFALASESLIEHLLSDDDSRKVRHSISNLSQAVIVEFILRDFSLATIYTIPQQLFSRFDVYLHIHGDFPHGFSLGDFRGDRSEDRAVEDFHLAVEERINSLTIEERLRYLKLIYESELEEGVFIFQVQGLRTQENIDIDIGQVNFYNPKFKQYLVESLPYDDDDFKVDECFKQEEDEHFGRFVNAAAKISYRDIETGAAKAAELVELSLDVIEVTFNSREKLEVSTEKCIVVDNTGGFEAVKSDSKELDLFNAQELKHNSRFESGDLSFVSSYIHKLPTNQSEPEKRIVNSLHWYRKGRMASRQEDKLLNFWVAIENLLPSEGNSIYSILPEKYPKKKYYLAKEVISSLEAFYYSFDAGWELYNYIGKLSPLDPWNPLQLSEELLEESDLRPGDSISLVKFVGSLDKILTEINEPSGIYERKLVIGEKIARIKKFYADNSFAKKTLEARFKEVQDSVLLTYWYRNKIVHDAHFESTVLPYYVKSADQQARSIIQLSTPTKLASTVSKGGAGSAAS